MTDNGSRLTDDEYEQKNRIYQITENWLFKEPLFYDIFATHQLAVNQKMGCTLRTGQGRIEFNPFFSRRYNDNDLEELLKIEVMRIILKHPYTRRPDGVRDDASLVGSDMIIVQYCKTNFNDPTEIYTPERLQIPRGYCYEEYCKILTQLFDSLPPEESCRKTKINGDAVDNKNPSDQDSDSEEAANEKNTADNNQGQNKTNKNGQNQGGNTETRSKGDANLQGGSGRKEDLQSISANAKERSELWEEDSVMEETVLGEIEKNYTTKTWGSVPGNLVGLLIPKEKPKLHYKRILAQFRATLLSNKKMLTRMRPSRRYGFAQMGSRYDFTTNILVAVDTSGSISDKDLDRFFSAINEFFHHGVKQLDVLQFDYQMQGKVQSMKKLSPKIQIQGRGGTSFQPAYDYCTAHKEYNGLIFFTDGYADEPKVSDTFKAKVVWILDNEDDYKINAWLNKFGFTTYFEDSK